MELLGIGLIALAGGLLNGVSGFGALIVMTPLFVFFLSMESAISLGVLCGVALQLASFITYRAHVEQKDFGCMMLGSLPGVWAGGTLLKHAPEVALKGALGLFIILYVIWSQTRRVSGKAGGLTRAWAAVAGFFSGLFGGAFGIIGPPAVIYATRAGWSPSGIKGFLGQYFVILFTIIAFSLWFRGLMAPQVWTLAAWVIPTCLAGSWIGRRISSRLLPQHYMRLVFMLLFCMGLSLCWPAVRTLLSA